MRTWWMVGMLAASAALFACSDSPPANPSKPACVEEGPCECEDGRPGSNVCDLDSGEFVMCLCSRRNAPEAADEDAGSKPAPNQISTVAGAPAAGSGGAGAGASGRAGSGGERAEEAGAGGAAGEKGHGRGKGMGKNPKQN